MVRRNPEYVSKFFSIVEKGICLQSVYSFTLSYRSTSSTGVSAPTRSHLFSNVVHASLDVDGLLSVTTLDSITYSTTGVELDTRPPKPQTALFWFAADARVFVLNRFHLLDWRRFDADDVVPRAYRLIAGDIGAMCATGRSALVLDFVNSYLIVNVASDNTSCVATVKRALRANERAPIADVRVLTFN